MGDRWCIGDCRFSDDSQVSGCLHSAMHDPDISYVSVREINWDYYGDAVPAFLTLIIIPLTYK